MIADTKLRVLTASILIPLVVAAIWWGPTALVAMVGALVAIAAMLEFFAMGGRLGFQAYRAWTCLAALAVFAQQWCAAEQARITNLGDLLYSHFSPQFTLDLVLFVFLLGAAAIALGSRRALAEVLPSVSISVAGLFVIAIPLSTVVRLHGVDVSGPKLLLFTAVLVWTGDTAAYFVGRSFGRVKLAPQLSPNKTWEGAIANLVAALLVGVVFGYWTHIQPVHMLAIAALGSVSGQIGDIFKSAFKRGVGVKDSGTLLPGHGGMWDRIDALIFAAPAVWYYFEWVVMKKY
jgi:phosphatidate cytidylyltransferase